MSYQTLLKEIRAKIIVLKNRNERIVQENNELRNDNFNYLKLIQNQQNELAALQSELKTCSENSFKKNKIALEKEIDKYIELIDKTIAMTENKNS